MTTVSPRTPRSTELRPLRRPGLYWDVADALVLAWRRLVTVPREPEELVFSIIQPIMFVLLFRYVFGGAINVGHFSYVNFVIPGIFVQTVIFGATNTGIGLAYDLKNGLIDRFRSLPMARSAVLMGRTLADLFRNAVVVAVMLAVGFLVGFRPNATVGGWILSLALLLLISFAFSWISAFIGLSVRTVEAAQSAGFVWLFPLTFASSAFAPTQTMPNWLRTFADNQPVTFFVNAVRDLLLGQPTGNDVWLAFGSCVAILIIFIPLGVRAYNRRTTR